MRARREWVVRDGNWRGTVRRGLIRGIRSGTRRWAVASYRDLRSSALSGGQKVKVVIAAAMWALPHIVILDEPTNYLDRDSLGALAGAIRTYEGGVVMITHNNEFCSALCPETWLMQKDPADGIAQCNCKGDAEWMAKAAKESVQAAVQLDEITDALGNVVKIEKEKKSKDKMSRKEKKQAEKIRKAKIARGEAVSSDDEDWGED